jgi:hypothetical protein
MGVEMDETHGHSIAVWEALCYIDNI